MQIKKIVIPFAKTIRSYFTGSQVPRHEFIRKEIVDVIIGEMFFHPDDGNEEIMKERALKIFSEVEVDDQCHRDYYHINIRNHIQFNLVIDYLSVGVSFRMAASLISITKQQTGLREAWDV